MFLYLCTCMYIHGLVCVLGHCTGQHDCGGHLGCSNSVCKWGKQMATGMYSKLWTAKGLPGKEKSTEYLSRQRRQIFAAWEIHHVIAIIPREEVSHMRCLRFVANTQSQTHLVTLQRISFTFKELQYINHRHLANCTL